MAMDWTKYSDNQKVNRIIPLFNKKKTSLTIEFIAIYAGFGDTLRASEGRPIRSNKEGPGLPRSALGLGSFGVRGKT